jgi:flagellar biogenesis protein FliO
MKQSLARTIVSAWTLAAAAAMVASPSAAQTLPQGGTEAPVSLGRVVAALVLCMLLALAGALVLRRRALGGAIVPGPGASLFAKLALLQPPASRVDRRLSIVQTVQAGASLHVCLIKLDGQEYLVASTPQAITLLNGPVPPQGSVA